MDECLKLPARALAQKKWDMPSTPEGPMPEKPREVLPSVGDKLDFRVTGTVSAVKNGVAEIEGVAIDGFAVVWPKKGGAKSEADEDGELEAKAEAADKTSGAYGDSDAGGEEEEE